MGTNDVIADACGPDQVAAGILSIVEQLRIRRPDAWIVVQSLLPSKKAEPFVVNSINEATKCLTRGKCFSSTAATFSCRPPTRSMRISSLRMVCILMWKDLNNGPVPWWTFCACSTAIVTTCESQSAPCFARVGYTSYIKRKDFCKKKDVNI